MSGEIQSRNMEMIEKSRTRTLTISSNVMSSGDIPPCTQKNL